MLGPELKMELEAETIENTACVYLRLTLTQPRTTCLGNGTTHSRLGTSGSTVNTIPHRHAQPNLIQKFNNWEDSRMAAGCVKLKMFKAKWAPVLNVEYQSMAEAWAVHKHPPSSWLDTMRLLLPRLPGRITLPSLNHFAQVDKKLT